MTENIDWSCRQEIAAQDRNKGIATPVSQFRSAFERDSKFRVGAHERVEREASIEATGIRQDPDRYAPKCRRLVTPRSVPEVHHGCVRALSEECDRTWRKAAHPLLELGPSLSEFLRRVVEQMAFILRPKTHISEAR
jgi:hypothetical protein